MRTLGLVLRLAAKDLLGRRGETATLVLVVLTATAVLTVGLALDGVTSHPYATTRQETRGPDVIATDFVSGGGAAASRAALAKVAPIAHARGVVAASGPFPVAFPVLRVAGRADAVLAEGRSAAPAAVDQPRLTAGSWVRPGGVVLERSFADALGVHVGERVRIGSAPFSVAGVAVSAAFPVNGLGFLEGSARWPNPGLVWLTENDARHLASARDPLSYVLDVRIRDAARAGGFADRYDRYGYTDNTGGLYVIPWQMVSRQDGLTMSKEQKILVIGSWLLALLAAASLAVLVGGRMAEQRRRVGLLKAVGSTPALVAGVLWTEYLAIALVAALVGLVVGRLAAPLLTSPGAGLLGTAGAPQLSASSVGLVVLLAVAVASLATLLPALRAARTSTVDALADTARPPRRRGRLITWSSRLPVPWLLAARLVARRPRRFVLGALSIAVTVSGVVAVLFAHATVAVSEFGASAGRANPDRFDVGFISQTARVDEVLFIVAVMLVLLASVNVVFIVRSTVQDTRRARAVTRALGATPGQVAAGLSLSQIAPSVVGAILGLAGGYGMFTEANQGGSLAFPPAWTLAAALVLTVVSVAGLTAVPAQMGGRVPVAEVLQDET
jgi:ABC-type lipoprotein release transport system permease subunit